MSNLEFESAADGEGASGRIADLSERQYDCLVRAGEGMSSKEIGRVLGISPSTVDNHIHVAITKLNAKNRWHAAQLIGPIRTKIELTPEPSFKLIPPLGGRSNRTPARWRMTQMLAIAALSMIALTAAIVLIMGAIEVFGLG
jgi:DNA-binding CsgD family transcriptional regulator